MEKTREEIMQALAEPYPACEMEYKTKPFPALYIDSRTPTSRLNKVLPGRWSFKLAPDVRRDRFDNISRDGCLVIHWPDGRESEFWSTGTETADYQQNAATGEWMKNNAEPKAEKGADSDCFKRCCFRAGIGAYIYELPKEIKGNQLTKADVEQAARLAGYQGEIKPEHYGSLNKGRARDASEAAPVDPPARSSAPKLTDTANDPLAGLKSTYSQLGKELFPDNPNACKEYVFDKIGTLTAANLPDAVDALRSLKKQREQPGGLV